MGRVAGVPRSIQSGKAWREEVANEKICVTLKPPKPPLATLPATKRRVLLLWLISDFLDGQMPINIKSWPVYTDDMKLLVRDKFLDLIRKNGVTVLHLTKRAEELLQSSKIKQSEKDWIVQSFKSSSLR